ncbi:glycosyl hydrolase family 8 [Salinarimonas sp.]|uniref:glycosyl hydrolase family 8 n=1 Tax=Salinarimonas sp. TaxID=2766526 RepID=UPI0032D9950A
MAGFARIATRRLAAGLALAAGLVAAGSGEAAAAPPAPWLVAAWEAYAARFVEDGRVVDDANGITHSEGQGYAMLIAVRAGDRAGFDRIWDWTRRSLMIREDGLVAWRWEEGESPGVTDPNNATDGDVLVAWALLEAAERWRVPAYAEAARALAVAVGEATLIETPYGLSMLPGAAGFRAGDQPDGPIANLSYWVFPAFDRLAGIAPEYPWAALEETGLSLIAQARFGPLRLPPDWIALGGETLAPADGFAPLFGYNGIRIPLYLAWAGSGGREHLAMFAGMWSERDDIGPFEIDVATGAATEEMGGDGYKAIAAFVGCALQGRPLPERLRSVPMQKYYPTTLHILTLIAIEERFPQCL